MMQSLNIELTNMNSMLLQLKQEINLSKVDIEHIADQGQQHVELVQRLNVLVESTSDDGDDGKSVSLSMERVQVMVAAAARQIVAGSKWITKEAFDLRVGEFRREYLCTIRQVQAQMEDLTAVLANVVPPTSPNGAQVRLP